jgi:hypothetical protein
MKKHTLFLGLLYFIFSITNIVHATSSPLFTLTPLTPTTIQLLKNSTATVEYIVTNMSSKTHTLMIEPVTGITQVTGSGNCASAFTLTAKQSCTLTLLIEGSQLSGSIVAGPRVCQQGSNGKPSPLLCYQPSPSNILTIVLITPPGILYTGTENGNVFYSIDDGATWITTAVPAGGIAINAVFATNTTLYAGTANGHVYSSVNNGNTWSLIVTPALGFEVNGLYISTNKLYIASANSSVFICALDGTQCTSTNSPSGSSLNGVFATANALYVASDDGYVYYSTNNGVSWSAINGQPDSSAVKSVYVAANTLYVDTADEYVYTSTSLTGGGTWSLYAQTVYSLFVNSNASQIFAGNQAGYVFSLSTGTQLGFVESTGINSVFLFN